MNGDVGARLDRYLERATSFGFSGTVLVADTNGVLLSRGYGFADEARGIANSPSTIFDMGSIVKQFTAAAILLLESEGKLATSDTIGKFFPEVPADKAAITLHQLLTHTSGLLSDVAGDYDAVGRDSALRVMWNTPLVSRPGVAFNYSNAGFALLGAIIEKISSESYEAFMQRRIFAPAGMTETSYRIGVADSVRVAHTYTPPVDHGSPSARMAATKGPWWNLMANGGMFTTVGDIYRYELALRRGQPISKAIQAKQFSVHFRRTPTLANGYDWWIEPAEDGGDQFNRGGDANQYGLNAEYRRYPKDGSVFILLANNRHHGWSSRRFIMPNMRRLFLGPATIEPPSVTPSSPAQLAPLLGVYQVDSASYFRVDTARGRLVLSAFGQNAANVLVFNRDTTSMRNRERINERALSVIRALATGDSAASATLLGSPARGVRLSGAWRDAEKIFGRFYCVDVLGTDRLDRGAFLTTARLRFADSTKTIRFTWNAGIPAVNSDDGELVNNFGFAIDSPVEAGVWSPYWYASGRDSIVTYDLITNQTLIARVEPNALVFEVPGRPVRATRIPEGAAEPSLPSWCRSRESAELAMIRYAMHGMSGSVLLEDNGRVVLQQGYGLADREAGVPASVSTKYDVGSITKTFTAAAVLRLVADGKLDLHAPLGRYFDGVPADKAGVTLHQILIHTAGFGLDPASAGVLVTDSSSTYVRKVLAAPLVHPAGSAYAYSNTGYGLLVILVERVAGEDFRTFVNRRLIQPAGLATTGWWGDAVAVSGAGVAKGYEFSDREYTLSAEPAFGRGAPASPMWSKWPLGAGGIVTTVGDLHQWLTALRESRVLPDSLSRRLFESQSVGVGSQGYGWNVATHPTLGPRMSRGGGRTGFTSLLAYYPRQNAAVAFALNQQAEANWQSAVWRSLERALAGVPDTLPPATVAVSTSELQTFAGDYEVSPGARIRIVAEDGALIVGAEGQPAADLLVSWRGVAADSVAAVGSASLEIVRRALRRDTADARVNDFRGFSQWLSERATNPRTTAVAVIGTVPHPSGGGAMQTFFRVGTSSSAPMLRLIWSRGKVVGWGDGVRLPGFGRFRITSRTGAVAFHPRDPAMRFLEFQRDARDAVTGVVVIGPSGARSLPLRRLPSR